MSAEYTVEDLGDVIGIRRADMPFKSAFFDFTRRADAAAAVLFAAALVPITVFVGAAVETARLTKTKAHMQNAIDAATLAAANGSESPEAVFSANLQDSSASQARSSFKKNADGSVSGAASAFVSTPLMKLFTDSGVAIAAKAKAGKVYVEMPQTTSLSMSSATGWYWKKIDLYIHKKGDATDTLMASYIYQPVDLSGVGVGTTTALFNVNGIMVGNAISTPVYLGGNYDKAYLTMTVYSDSCGPGEMPPPSPAYIISCSPISGSYVKSPPVIFSTDDPKTAHNLFVNGVHLPDNSVADFTSVLPCGTTVQHAWEDTVGPTPLTEPLTGSWAGQDVFFSVKSYDCTPSFKFKGVALIQ